MHAIQRPHACVHRKETLCEFCSTPLPDWRASLTPEVGCSAPAIMNVNFDGVMYSFEVKPGADGYAEFTDGIRHAFSLPEGCDLNITFTCDEPSTGVFSCEKRERAGVDT